MRNISSKHQVSHLCSFLSTAFEILKCNDKKRELVMFEVASFTLYGVTQPLGTYMLSCDTK